MSNLKRTVFILLLTGICGISQMHGQVLQTEQDSISYSVGMMVAQSVSSQVGEISYDAFMEGFRHQMEDAGRLLTMAEAQEYLNAYGEVQRKKESEQQNAAGTAFLEQNAQREGVVVLDNGLQYEVLVAAPDANPRPGPTDKVKVHYHGTLISGEVFDSSVERGEPASFGVGQVIRGWTEILQLMPVGSKWKVYIPQELAYGERGAGAKIKPYSTLIFEIELIEIL